MDVNETEAETASLDPDATWEEDVEEDDSPKESLLVSSWRGAVAGFWLTSYIIGPIAGLVVIPGLVLMEFGLGTGRGFSVPDFLLGALGFYLVSAAWGGVIGAVVGLVVGGLFGPGRPGSRRAAWSEAANRPIRLFRRRKQTASTERSKPDRSNPIWRQWPFWLGLPVQVAMTGGFLAGVYLGWTVDRRLAEARAAADMDDPAWRLDDLLANRDPVPYEENSAIVVAEAIDLMPRHWPVESAQHFGGPQAPPTEASRAYDRMSHTLENVRLDAATAETLRDELEKYREALGIARTVMYYDRGRHDLEIGPIVFDTPLRVAEESRAVGRLLAADAAIRAHDGEIDRALDSCRAILGAGRSIGDEPTPTSQLVRAAAGGLATRAARRAMGQGEPSDAALARLQELALDELHQPLLLYGINGERAMVFELIRRVSEGDVPISALSEPLAHFEIGGFGPRVAPWTRLMYDTQMAVALEWLNRAVDISRVPAPERQALWEAWDAERQAPDRAWHGPYTSGLPRRLTAGLSVDETSQSRREADLGATIILLAAERHRLRTGAWPASAAHIDPDILPDPPTDPFSGGPFRMEHRDGRLVIYSIGPNRQDEHGALDLERWGTKRLDDIGTVGWDVNLRRQPPSEPEETVEDDRPSS